jgi:hypothetical protein
MFNCYDPGLALLLAGEPDDLDERSVTWVDRPGEQVKLVLYATLVLMLGVLALCTGLRA